MGDDLKNRKLTEQLQMPDYQKQQADVKKHQKNPQHRFVPPHTGK
jgi:hypothetical protein